MQFCNRFDFAVLAFLQLRREHILEPVRLVESKWNRLVIRIDHQVTATRLVVRIKIVPFEYRKILERPFSFGTQLGNSCCVTYVETAPFGTLPGEVNGATVFLNSLCVLHKGCRSHSRQNRDIANW